MRRITVRTLMAAVAVLAGVLAAFRAHVSLGSFAFGVGSIAWLRTTEAIQQRAATGLATGTGRAVGIFLSRALAVAGTLLACLIPAGLMAHTGFPLGHVGHHGGLNIEWWLALSVVGAVLFFRMLQVRSVPPPEPPQQPEPTTEETARSEFAPAPRGD